MLKKLVAVSVIALGLTACNKIVVTDEQIKEAVKEVLQENPKLIADALGKAGAPGQRPQVDEAAVKAALKKYDKELFKNPSVPYIGSANAKNVVVEFFDYNCGYCKRVLETVETLAKDHDSKVILMDMAILGPQSRTAALYSLAIHELEPSKYIEYHRAMMKAEGRPDEAGMKQIITSIGMDPAKVDAESKKEEYSKILSRHMEIAQSLGIGGTPSFVVNGNVVKGALPLDAFKAHLK